MFAMAAAVVSITVSFTVMIAADIGIVGKGSIDKGLCCCIGITCDAAVQLNAGLGECFLCTAADPAADQCIRADSGKEAGKCAVSLSEGRHDVGGDDDAVLDFVDLEGFGVAEMTENLTVFVCDCKFHYDYRGFRLSKAFLSRISSRTSGIGAGF